MKLFNQILFLILFFMAGIVSAYAGSSSLVEKVGGSAYTTKVPLIYAEIELYPLRIKLSDDGTGIIKNMSCAGCGYKFGKITKNTRAYVNNINVDLFRARKRAGTLVLVQFVRSTGEVMAIRWSE